MSILIFVAILVLLILVHELGHFFFAKLFGVKVKEFGIGYPPRALKIAKLGDTDYTLNWIPFGGFVNLLGEASYDDDDKNEKHRRFDKKHPLQQILILSGGVLFNFIFAWILFSAVFFSGTPLFWDKNYVEGADLIVSETLSGSPADLAGIESGDIIKEVYIEKASGEKEKPALLSPQFVSSFMSENAGEKVSMLFYDSSEKTTRQVELTPVHGISSESPSSAAVGVRLTLLSRHGYSLFESVYLGFASAVNTFKQVCIGIYTLAKDAAFGKADLKNVAGPIGIASLISDASAVGFAYLVYFVAIISVNLAVINLIPIPALDGGRIVLVALEYLSARKSPKWLEASLNIAGFALLIILMIAVTYNDIVRLLSG